MGGAADRGTDSVERDEMNEITQCPYRMSTIRIDDQETIQQFMPCDKEKCSFYSIGKHLTYTRYQCICPPGIIDVCDFNKPNPESEVTK